MYDICTGQLSSPFLSVVMVMVNEPPLPRLWLALPHGGGLETGGPRSSRARSTGRQGESQSEQKLSSDLDCSLLRPSTSITSGIPKRRSAFHTPTLYVDATFAAYPITRVVLRVTSNSPRLPFPPVLMTQLGDQHRPLARSLHFAADSRPKTIHNTSSSRAEISSSTRMPKIRLLERERALR